MKKDKSRNLGLCREFFLLHCFLTVLHLDYIRSVVRNELKLVLERLVDISTDMSGILGMTISTGMGENGEISGMRTGMRASMECWDVVILVAALDLETCIN